MACSARTHSIHRLPVPCSLTAASVQKALPAPARCTLDVGSSTSARELRGTRQQPVLADQVRDEIGRHIDAAGQREKLIEHSGKMLFVRGTQGLWDADVECAAVSGVEREPG